MKCPSCGNGDAYQGLSSVDCPNTSCRHYQGNKTITAPVPVAPRLNPNPNPNIPVNGPSANPGQQLQLGVAIISQVPKVNSVMVSFKGWGDPGNPDKRVEFYHTLPGGGKTICTLSNMLKFYVDGVDADNVTIYNTHWMCMTDGVRPTDNFVLEAVIFP